MADGIPAGMDGHLLWNIEPEKIPRLCPDVKDRAKRLKCLGNAVVPAQVYPVLKYIADMEKGECTNWCVCDNGCVLAKEGSKYEKQNRAEVSRIT